MSFTPARSPRSLRSGELDGARLQRTLNGWFNTSLLVPRRFRGADARRSVATGPVGGDLCR